MYPLQFGPVFKDYLWGGRNLAGWGKKLPKKGIVAESWEVSGHPEGVSLIANGDFAGQSLVDLIERYPTEVLGSSVALKYGTKMPLLVKLIDATQKLSVQVHPDDAYALLHENEFGKHEFWYILAAGPEAKIIYGLLPGTTREKFTRCIEQGQAEACLQYREVTVGDVIDIPPGMVHALGAGIVLIEIQQNSNATYRVFDYNRVDARGQKRPLHVKKALDVIDFSPVKSGQTPVGAVENLSPGVTRTMLTKNTHFQVDRYQIKDELKEIADGKRFYIYTFLEGSGKLAWAEEEISVRQGDSLLVPAVLGEYRLCGNLCVLKSYATTNLKTIGV